ncbi:MAG: histone deacetylase family protein [Colwellia sp.]|nr:histone deacetylase family protein [Colwellia sp.]
MPVGVIGHYRCSEHNMGDHHPESPKRMSAVQDQLIRSGLEYVIRQYDAKPIERELLYLVHDKSYIESIFNNAPTEGTYTIDGDTLMNPATLRSALYSAGAAIDAVDLVMAGTVSSVFCATRPPGHHATKNQAMGFCFFNNIALAAAYAKEKYHLERIAIVDFDVHHGNGTEDIVAGKNGYLFLSSFQYPLYPFTETEKEAKETLHSSAKNIIYTPLPATTKGDDFRQAINQSWLPVLREFKPQMIFISAGFDAHIEDEISHMSLTEDDYFWITKELKAIAKEHAQGRVVSVLEGGYALSALGRSVVAHIKGLIGH